MNMNTDPSNEGHYEQYFRKVDTKRSFKRSWKFLGLYFTVSNCRVKKRTAYIRRQNYCKWIFKIKEKIFKANDGRCQYCGRKHDLNKMQLHHVLPVARFQDYIYDERNMLLLCHECHQEIHCNPFLNCKLMQDKGNELGIDLHERYSYL